MRRRVVDATYLVADDPGDDSPAVRRRPTTCASSPINELAGWTTAPSSYVIVGSGKTATDGIVWLLANGVEPDRITWVRPRDPWMLNRAVVQPDPVGRARARRRHHGGGRRRRVARRSVPAPRGRRRDAPHRPRRRPDDGEDARRSATWELELLRTVEHVVRLGHIEPRDRATRSCSTTARCRSPPGSLVVHCAASGPAVPAAGPALGARRDPPPDDPGRLPLLLRRAGRLRRGDARRRPRAQPAVPAEHAAGQPRQLGADAGARDARGRGSYGAEPDIAAWAERLRAEPGAHRPVATETIPRCQAALGTCGGRRRRRAHPARRARPGTADVAPTSGAARGQRGPPARAS